MNIWITKNIRFGYKYTLDKKIRKEILKSTNWIINTLKSKSSKDDIFILSGGLFSNTNPSIVAINDAHNFISNLKNICNVYLVNSDKDNRLFEGEYFSTLDIFNYVNIINDITIISNITIILFNKIYNNGISLDVESGIFNNEKIPSLMQLDKNEDIPGIIVYNVEKQKHIFIENKTSPKHKTFVIKNITELINLSENKDNCSVHLIIDKSLLIDNKNKIDVIIHKINPNSIKYIDEIENDILNSININEIDVDKSIISHIGDKQEVLNQFLRIKNIIDNK